MQINSCNQIIFGTIDPVIVTYVVHILGRTKADQSCSTKEPQRRHRAIMGNRGIVSRFNYSIIF